MTLDTVIPPTLALGIPKVIPPVLVMPPLIVNVFVPEAMSVFILDAVATVMVPDKVAAVEPLTNLIAPVVAPFKPVPLMVMASGMVNADPVPLISKAARFPMVVPKDDADVPNASPLVIRTVPALIEVVPA